MTGMYSSSCAAAAARSSTPPRLMSPRPTNVAGKTRRASENRAQHLDVFLRRDAAEQHELRVGARLVVQRASRLLERRAVAGIRDVDLGVSEANQHLRRDGRLGRYQSLIRRDDECAAELARVGDLAAEVQAAHVREQVAYRHPVVAKTRRHRKTWPSARAPAGHAARGSSPAREETRGTSLVRFYQRHAARPVGSIARPMRNSTSVANARYPAAG